MTKTPLRVRRALTRTRAHTRRRERTHTRRREAQDCAAGTYQPLALHDSSCLPCEIGTYQPLSGSSSCLNCTGWTSTAATGAKASSDCINFDLAKIARGGMYDLASAQMAYYPFASANPLRDVSGKLGALTSSPTAPTTVEGPWPSSSAASFEQGGNRCLRLSAGVTGQYYRLPILSLSSPDLSVCLWHRPRVREVYPRLFDFSNGARLDNLLLANQPNTNNTLCSLRNVDREIFARDISFGVWSDPPAWHHVCIALKDKVLSVYNDQAPSDFTLDQPISAGERKTNYLARSAPGWDDCLFVGEMAQVRDLLRA